MLYPLCHATVRRRAVGSGQGRWMREAFGMPSIPSFQALVKVLTFEMPTFPEKSTWIAASRVLEVDISVIYLFMNK